MLMHRFPEDGAIAAKFQQAELDYLLNSDAGLRTIAENYVGLPMDFGH
jgi:p-hydroxybenzoate 3-monooxygenase